MATSIIDQQERPKQATHCRACGSGRITRFHRTDGCPTNSVLLLTDRAAARAVPSGTIELGFCEACGFVQNTEFEPLLTEYSDRYESTQSYSGTFNAFNSRLAREMVERFDLHGREIIEIGCGHGEFLVTLCELGGNKGIGFDPAHLPGRVNVPEGSHVEFVRDFYSERYADRQADFVVCKMTLEHISDCANFVRTVRRAVGDRPTTTVYFQVPNARYVFGDLAFWDVYYEHCSYFTSGSLARLFRRERFDVLDLWTEYDDQYLMIVAQPSELPTVESLDVEHDLADVDTEVNRFGRVVPDRIESWRHLLRSSAHRGETTVVWGGGSKGVAFLTSVGAIDVIAAVVDINPHKAGSYMSGTGHPIVGPDMLTGFNPDTVIIMNPVYTEEIRHQLSQLGLSPRLLPVA